jgi:large subunit ribosomal protein L25
VESIELEIEARTGSGTRTSRRIRRSGFIPSIVYARGEKALSTQVPTRAFVQTASLVRSSQLFTLKSSSKELNGRSALVKGIQREFLSGNVLHIDFQALHENEEIVLEIPLKFVGESTGVKNDGGILTIMTHDITVSCLPKQIPTEIVIDVSALGVGDSVHARELKLPEGVSLSQNPDASIVSVVIPRQVAEAAPAAAAAAEGAAAAPGAEGAAAAPAAAGAADKKPAEDKKK